MKGVSVTFVGDNEQANVAVANALAKTLGHASFHAALIEQVTSSTRKEILAEDGEAGLVIAENAVLEQLSTMIRCCVATSGGGKRDRARRLLGLYLRAVHGVARRRGRGGEGEA